MVRIASPRGPIAVLVALALLWADTRDPSLTSTDIDDEGNDVNRKDTVGWGLVALQSAALAGLVLTPRGAAWPTPRPVRIAASVMSVTAAVGGAAAAHGLGASLTPSPVPKEEAQLETGGMYAVVRHPIYAFLLLFAAGQTLGGGSRARLAILAGLVALLHVKAGWEERMLEARYPGYPAYAAHTPRLVPTVRKRSRP